MFMVTNTGVLCVKYLDILTSSHLEPLSHLELYLSYIWMNLYVKN